MIERDRITDRDAEDEAKTGSNGTEKAAREASDRARLRSHVIETSAPSGPEADAEFDRQMEIGRHVMRKHQKVLAALAK